MSRQRTFERGTVIGRYVVDELIGAGGMGEVYSALDTQLGRLIALKVLPAGLGDQADRIDRFVHEARAASSLNHAGIVTIFDSGTHEGLHFLTMEVVDGVTLGDWARSGRNRRRLPGVLAQIAEAMAVAHGRGIIHRDLKPDNVMVTGDGVAKIVDFGVAKLTERLSDDPADTIDTAPAAVLGTTAFMSPEQVERRPVDVRSDVFSFGSLIYAAYQGRSPFDRDSAVRTMNAIVSDSPPPLPEGHPGIERIARRCLAKDAEERYQSMKDVALDLREVSIAIVPRPSPRARLTWLSAGLVASLTLAGVAWSYSRRPSVNGGAGARVVPPEMTMTRLTNSGKIVAGAITPDGKYVVYASEEGDEQSVWLRQIASGTSVRIVPPMQGFYGDLKVSPDGDRVVFSFAPRANANVSDIYEVPLLGGNTTIVAHDADGPIEIAPDSSRVAFRRFDAVARRLSICVTDRITHAERVILTRTLPDALGSALAWTPDSRRLTIVTGSLKSRQSPVIANFDFASGRLTPMAHGPGAPIGNIEWLPDASGIVYTAAERQQPPQLWYLAVDEGPARKITSDLAEYSGLTVTADSKALAVHRREDAANVWIVDASGAARPITKAIGDYFGACGVSWLADGKILYSQFANGEASLRVLNLSSGESHELMHGPGWAFALSPDRSTVAFLSARTGSPEVWLMDAGGGNLRQLTRAMAGGTNIAWFPDGRSLAYISSGTVQAAWKTTLDGTTERLTDRPANTPAISPDGKLLLCRIRSANSETPLWRTALMPIDGKGPVRYFAVPRVGGPRLMQWLPGGRSFAYLDMTGGAANVWVQPIHGGAPRQVTHFTGGRIYAYDIAPDGKTIVVSRGEPTTDVVMIRNFR